MGFPGSSVVKNPPANAGDLGLISGLGRSPRGGNGNSPQHFCQGKSQTQLSTITTTVNTYKLGSGSIQSLTLLNFLSWGFPQDKVSPRLKY